jgi:hypothetical protein
LQRLLSMLPLLWLNRPGDGKAAPFCGWENAMKIQLFWGGVSHSQIASSRLNSSVCPVKIFKHTTINHQVAGLWLNWPGDGKAATFCGHDNSTKNQCLRGGGLVIAKLQPAGQIHLAPLVSLLNHTTINLGVEVACKRGGGCGPCIPGGGPDHGGQRQRTM